MPVNTERSDYTAATPKWGRLRDCDGGRDAILKGGLKYVPDLPGADKAANKAYRERGNFYNAVTRTVQGLTGSLFQKAPEIDVPPTAETYLNDITLTNITFEMFANTAGLQVMLVGRYGVLIDLPAPAPAGVVATYEIRPYCVGYLAEDIVNWRTERRGGDEILTMLVLRETAEVIDEKDPFVCKTVCQFRVLQLENNSCTRQLYREKEGQSGQFEAYEEKVTLQRRGTPLDFIPFVFFGPSYSSPDICKPPLLDLADVNLGHWRNSVDYEYGLHLTALPTPWVSGLRAPAEGATSALKIGPSVVWELDAQGQAGMLEFTGSGLGALVVAMDDKKKQMASLGARLFEEPVKGDTATAVMIRHSGEQASLRTIAGSVEQSLTMVLQTVVWWESTEDHPVDVDTVEVELNKEYLDVRATPQEIQVALTALQAGEISFDTWWNLLMTGGWGREGIDAAAEQKAIAERKAVATDPTLDPSLSTVDPPPAAAAPKRRTIRGADGNVKYTVEETDAAA